MFHMTWFQNKLDVITMVLKKKTDHLYKLKKYSIEEQFNVLPDFKIITLQNHFLRHYNSSNLTTLQVTVFS